MRYSLNIFTAAVVVFVTCLSQATAQEFYSSTPASSGSGAAGSAPASTSGAVAPDNSNTSVGPTLGGVTSPGMVGVNNSNNPNGGGNGALTGAPFGGKYARGPFRYSVSVNEGYNDNLFQTRTNKNASFYTNWAGGITYSFGTPRLQMSMLLNGGVTYYYSRPGNQIDYTGGLLLNALYKATSRLLITFNTQTAYLAQPDVSIAGTSANQNGNYFFSSSTTSATYQWSHKFSTVSTYNFSTIYYTNQGLNDSQGFISQTFGQQARWLLLPKTNIVLEYRVNPITYYSADQNSLGQFALVGFDQIFNPRFTWNVRLGLEQRFLNNGTDGSSTYYGPYGESIFNYQVGQNTSISWNMRYGTEPSGLNDVTQRQTFRTGFNFSHAFTPRLSANLSFSYLNNYYTQSGVISNFNESIFQVLIGAQFSITRVWSVNAGYQFTSDISQETSREFNQNIVFVGTALNF